jgi:CO dehydrogenase/acetyl-CoA synthase gamma subunit (corrinoid Fe-S protein)
MAVEQEYADLYLLTVENVLEYVPDMDCGDCGFPSCVAFGEALVARDVKASRCTELDPIIIRMLDSLLELDIAPLPYNVMMESFPPAVIKLGEPDQSSPVMVTCNFQGTVQLLEKILGTCSVHGYLVMSDTKGYSVDNAIEEKRFTPFEILKAINESEVGACVTHRNLIIPGLARHLANQIKQTTGWDVVVGPVSGFEIPLFLKREDLAHWENG